MTSISQETQVVKWLSVVMDVADSVWKGRSSQEGIYN